MRHWLIFIKFDGLSAKQRGIGLLGFILLTKIGVDPIPQLYGLGMGRFTVDQWWW
jgi:hypothetical protein